MPSVATPALCRCGRPAAPRKSPHGPQPRRCASCRLRKSPRDGKPRGRQCSFCRRPFVPASHGVEYCPDCRGRSAARGVRGVRGGGCGGCGGCGGVKPYALVFEAPGFCGDPTTYLHSGHDTEAEARAALAKLRRERPGLRCWVEKWSARDDVRADHGDVGMTSEVLPL